MRTPSRWTSPTGLVSSVELPAGGLPCRDPGDQRGGETGEDDLVAEGFASRDIKLYTGEQILATFESYKQQRNLADRVVGVVSDIEGRDLYLEYAEEGRSALWMRIPNEDRVAKALRAIADRDHLHTRYYGADTETDYHVS